MSNIDSASRRGLPYPMFNTDRVIITPVSSAAPQLVETNTTGSGTVKVRFEVCNYTMSDTWFSFYIVPAGQTLGPSWARFFQTDLAAQETFGKPTWYTLHPGDSVYAEAGTANSVSLWADLEIEC